VPILKFYGSFGKSSEEFVTIKCLKNSRIFALSFRRICKEQRVIYICAKVGRTLRFVVVTQCQTRYVPDVVFEIFH
jgi:hypothetical protein